LKSKKKGHLRINLGGKPKGLGSTHLLVHLKIRERAKRWARTRPYFTWSELLRQQIQIKQKELALIIRGKSTFQMSMSCLALLLARLKLRRKLKPVVFVASRAKEKKLRCHQCRAD